MALNSSSQLRSQIDLETRSHELERMVNRTRGKWDARWPWRMAIFRISLSLINETVVSLNHLLERNLCYSELSVTGKQDSLTLSGPAAIQLVLLSLLSFFCELNSKCPTSFFNFSTCINQVCSQGKVVRFLLASLIRFVRLKSSLADLTSLFSQKTNWKAHSFG